MAKGDAKSTIQHFVKEGRRQTTVFQIIKRYKDTGKAEYAPFLGHQISKQMLKTQKKIETHFSKCPMSDIKVKKLGIRAQTQKKAPKYVKDQERRTKTGLRNIYKKTLRKTLVIDDETYVVLEPKGQP
ncbi:hypothetical protein ILUMI_07325 [Ignelater luminosus]|uniref:Uncharacterized protein n=1 Tax=Ignelater luminosus TaxID=2038154 RepID=A0A8K0D9K3_IGNLU|nr:hypothetical protein ILUMI_07325 [Ignelater luminosus]